METLVEPTTPTSPETGSTTSSSVTQTTPAPVSTTPSVERTPPTVKAVSAKLAALAAGVPATTSSVPAPAGAPAATVPGGTDPKVAASPSATPGPIPFPEHKTILENSRKELADYRAKHGWAERVHLDHFQAVSTLSQRMQTDPLGVLEEFVGQLERHPIYGPQLAQKFGAAPAAPQTPQQEVQILGPDGQPSGVTLSQLLKAEREQVFGTVQQQLAPLLEERKQRAEETKIAKIAEQQQQQADVKFARMARMLDIEATNLTHPLWKTVSDIWAANPQMEPEDVALAVRAQAITPVAKEQATAAALATMNKKAAGNTVNGTGTATTPQRATTVKEVAAILAGGAGRK